jgi:hypothetical protein
VDRLTVTYLVVLGSFVVFALCASVSWWFPFVDQATHSTWFPFLPPLIGSLVGVFAANRLEQRRARAEKEEEKREKEDEKRREKDALLANIRTELDQNMALMMRLLDPVKLHFIRMGEMLSETGEPLSERLYTETWDSCFYSGQTALLGFEEKRKIAPVYHSLQDYNARDWEQEDPDHRVRMLMNLREQIQRLSEESFWPKANLSSQP